MPSFGGGGIKVWTKGVYTTQLCDLSVATVNGNTRWNLLKWREMNADDESKGYVKVDILDSDGAVLQADLDGESSGGYQSVTLDYTNVKDVDIKIRFKLYALTVSPIVWDVQLR